jgi:C1A family cysteine protease
MLFRILYLFVSSYALRTFPDSFDWRDHNVVVSPKNQEQCGSCWAFSAVGAIESAYAIAAGVPAISLSEQQILDCSSRDGCGGGEMDNAFHWVEDHPGRALCREKDYPYLGRNGLCRAGCEPVVHVRDYVDVPPYSHDALLKALLIGPVAVAIEADQFSFQLYEGGVMGGRCGTNLDHGVLLVGYGTEDGKDYWLIKNSWGKSWGADGYIKLLRTKERGPGQCGIYLQASYPIIEIVNKTLLCSNK